MVWFQSGCSEVVSSKECVRPIMFVCLSTFFGTGSQIPKECPRHHFNFVKREMGEVLLLNLSLYYLLRDAYLKFIPPTDMLLIKPHL